MPSTPAVSRRAMEIAVTVTLGLALTACAPPGPGDGDATGPPDARSVTLAWEPPQRDAEGNPLTDLAGYRVYYTQSAPVTRERATVVEVSADETRHTLHGLAPGTWHFAVSAVDTSGNESALSEELRADLR